MNDDYLWDKSGEPDPQIQQLEEILGTLRYQPKPLQLPRRQNYRPWLAIAATAVFTLLAAGLWFMTRSYEDSIPAVAVVEESIPVINPPLSPATEPLKPRKRVLARNDRKQALAAKQQLMFALRLASEKLNAVHRRTQDKRSSYENTLPN